MSTVTDDIAGLDPETLRDALGHPMFWAFVSEEARAAVVAGAESGLPIADMRRLHAAAVLMLLRSSAVAGTSSGPVGRAA